MNLQEAIKHAEEVAKTNSCPQCSVEHKMLAHWLKELAAFRDDCSNKDCYDEQDKEIFKQYQEESRCSKKKLCAMWFDEGSKSLVCEKFSVTEDKIRSNMIYKFDRQWSHLSGISEQDLNKVVGQVYDIIFFYPGEDNIAEAKKIFINHLKKKRKDCIKEAVRLQDIEISADRNDVIIVKV